MNWGLSSTGKASVNTPPPLSEPTNNALFSNFPADDFSNSNFYLAPAAISSEIPDQPTRLEPPPQFTQPESQNFMENDASFFDVHEPTFEHIEPPAVTEPTHLPMSFQKLANNPPSNFSELPATDKPAPKGSNFVEDNTIPQVRPHWFYLLQDPYPPSSRHHPANVQASWPQNSSPTRTYTWLPFSRYDSAMLESADPALPVSVNGGRYEVDLLTKQQRSIFWNSLPQPVIRVTWFFRLDGEEKYTPFDEGVAEEIEQFYIRSCEKNIFPAKLQLEPGNLLIVHSKEVVIQALDKPSKVDPAALLSGPPMTAPQNEMIIRDLKRGITGTHFEKDVPFDERGQPDHVVFVVHGVGEVSDSQFRSLIECTNDMRSLSLQLGSTHYEPSQINRVEYLPVDWSSSLHGDDNGIEHALKNLSLPSIKRLRDFTNGTLTDILLYASPIYCQRIIDSIGQEISRLWKLLIEKFPNFPNEGKVSLAGHSLGSLILFDILCNQDLVQKPMEPTEKPTSCNVNTCVVPPAFKNLDKSDLGSVLEHLNISPDAVLNKFHAEEIRDLSSLELLDDADLSSIGIPLGIRRKLIKFMSSGDEKEAYLQRLSSHSSEVNICAMPSMMMNNLSILTLGSVEVKFDYQQFETGIGQPSVKYPHLPFDTVHSFFALGSPISMFLTVRGVSELGLDFELPTCKHVYNIFHPFDPCAYRLEPMVNSCYQEKPVLIPHHTGRKRLHLELRENISKMGTELKKSLIKNMNRAMQGFNSLIYGQTLNTQQEIDQPPIDQSNGDGDGQTEAAVDAATEEFLNTQREISRIESRDTMKAVYEKIDDMSYGQLNSGRRIDYVLQERPLEAFNDYLFAFQSHLCYWTSEDTVLMFLREMYGIDGVHPKQPGSPKSSS